MTVIKRYPNRKLYDTAAKNYVTLDEITEMIREGKDVHVIDHESGDDLTTLTLTQIILEQEKKSTGFLPRSLLTSLIRSGGGTLETLVRSVGSGLGMGGSDPEAVAEPNEPEPRSDARLLDMLNILNVPTRRDVKQLQSELESLSQRLDELIAERDSVAQSSEDVDAV